MAGSADPLSQSAESVVLQSMLVETEAAADYWEGECAAARRELDDWKASAIVVDALAQSKAFARAVGTLLTELEAVDAAWKRGDHVSFPMLQSRCVARRCSR
jgi:hypothetical protein